jgi:hypothetical protein
LNLAPIKYARVMADEGGPIERVGLAPLRNRREGWHQASAYLKGDLHLRKASVEVFGDADGTGTDRSPMIARFKAISEALERWALYCLLQLGETAHYGLDVDPTSNGMAAYPGLFRLSARRRAREEAVERFCLANWWIGQLAAREVGTEPDATRVIQLENPLTSASVVLVWRKDRHGLYAYGFAAARSLQQARLRASIELERSATALGAYLTRNPKFGPADLPLIKNWQERRILHFALPEGHEAFQRRLTTPPSPSLSAKRLKPLVDTELLGPWTRFATVWRVLFPMPGTAYLDPKELFFFW